MPVTIFWKQVLTAQTIIALSVHGHSQGIYNNGGSIFLSGRPSLVLLNSAIINNGSFFSGNSTVIFRGDAGTAYATIGGNNPILFNDLTIEKASNDVQLNADVSVNGIITMNGGNLQLNGFTLDLGSDSGTIIGESNASRIAGFNGGLIRKKALLNAPSGINPGNIGLSITSTGNWGMTVIQRGHLQQSSATGGSSINRYFDIQPEVSTGLNAVLSIYCFDAELAGRNRSELSLWASPDNGNTWSFIGKDNGNWNNGLVLGIRRHSRITLAGTVSRQAGFSVFPNPVTDMLYINIHSDRAETLRMALYDAAGRMIRLKDLPIEPGDGIYKWDISLVAAGAYFLRSSDTRFPVIKIIKKPA